ncbi:MAG: dUTP diphosphatase [Acidobacteria bacterium]|nr:dUTP diphosphatase [Acidobacteriota bacterium]
MATFETVEVKRLSPTARLPQRGSPLSAGFDLCASEDSVVPGSAVDSQGRVEIGRGLVPTGLAIAIPAGLYGRVAPRSGLAVKRGIDVGAGVIDADYRDEVRVVLFNFGSTPFEIRAGDRIAQIVFERIAEPELLDVEVLSGCDRGGGFGSTGLR